MGAGNPLIKSFDNDRYSPTTYFIDFTDFYTEETKLEYVKCHFADNDRMEEFNELNNVQIDEEFYSLLNLDVCQFQEDYFFNLDEKEMIADWREPHKDDKWLNECSAAFRGSAIILAENDDTYILTTDEAEIHHYPLAIIPKFKYEELLDELWDENKEKEDWYIARNKDLYFELEHKAGILYDKKLKKWRKKYQPFMRKFYEHWKDGLSMRNGAWMSIPLKIVGKEFEFV